MWYDRITQRDITQLPDVIQSTRYAAIETITVNGHSRLEPGDVLVDDGTARYRGTRSATSQFQRELIGEETAVEQDIINGVLVAFLDAISSGNTPGLLIPETLLSRLHLQPFDTVIKETIDRGHLQEISRSPKMELVYEENLLPIGRVKKVPPSASRHLAAHSECWQKRSFSGVIPRSLLALESEDEYNIYENRVYARLLDHLDRYLLKRCREVSRIEAAIAEAAEFEASEELHFGLVFSICQIWGEGFKAHQVVTDEAEQGQGTLEVLRSLLKQVRGLRSSRLYQSVPQRDDVGFRIRMTNALKHDQHYRHVARLWQAWLEYSNDGKVDPGIQFQLNARFAKAYFVYAEELVKRALIELGGKKVDRGFLMPGNRAVSVTVSRGNINLELAGSKLSIVPVYDIVNYDEYSELDEVGHSVIILTPELVDFRPGAPKQTASPLYFYVLEAMAARISSWLSSIALSVLSDSITKLPSTAKTVLVEKYSDYFLFTGTSAQLKRPLGNVLTSVHRDFERAGDDTSVSRFLQTLDTFSNRMDALLACPICGKTENAEAFHSRHDRAFEVSSPTCGHFWRIDRDRASNRVFIAGPIEDQKDRMPEDTFTRYGHFSMQIDLF